MKKRKLFGPDKDYYGSNDLGCEIIDMPIDEYQLKRYIFKQIKINRQRNN